MPLEASWLEASTARCLRPLLQQALLLQLKEPLQPLQLLDLLLELFRRLAALLLKELLQERLEVREPLWPAFHAGDRAPSLKKNCSRPSFVLAPRLAGGRVQLLYHALRQGWHCGRHCWLWQAGHGAGLTNAPPRDLLRDLQPPKTNARHIAGATATVATGTLHDLAARSSRASRGSIEGLSLLHSTGDVLLAQRAKGPGLWCVLAMGTETVKAPRAVTAGGLSLATDSETSFGGITDSRGRPLVTGGSLKAFFEKPCPSKACAAAFSCACQHSKPP